MGDEAEDILYKKGLNKKSLLDMINKEFAANYSTDLKEFEQDITEEYCNNIGLYKWQNDSEGRKRAAALEYQASDKQGNKVNT